MKKAAWWAVVAVAAAATLADEQTGGDTGPWLPVAHSPSWAWWAKLGEDGGAWSPGESGEGGDEAGGPLVAKRQPPHRLGNVLDLYSSVAHGLDTFSAKPVIAAPQRRSARWPAACKFNPFSLVCWNASRRSAMMRQRPLQYKQ